MSGSISDDRWPRIRVVVAVVAALAAGGAGFLGASSGRPVFIGAAAAFALVPLGYGAAALVRRGSGFPIGALLSIALVSALAVGGTAYVTVSSCDNRLGANADLAGCDFSEEDLSDEDLTGANLSDVDLIGADLRGADFTDADLTGAQLSDAALEGALFLGATLIEADLHGLDLSGISLTGADLADADLTGVSLDDAFLDGANLSGADLTGASLVGASLEGANLTAALLADIDAADADLENAVLDEADLTGGVLAQAELASASLSGADLTDADLTEAGLSNAGLDSATLDGADLTKASLSRADFTNASLDDVRLDDAFLVGVEGLTDSDLADALKVSEGELAETLIERDIRLQDRGEILNELGAACSGGGLRDAAPFGGPGLHPLVVLEANGNAGTFTDRVSKKWEPMAARFAELVACLQTERRETVEVCSYFDIGTGAPVAPITRYQKTRSVRLVEARTSRLVEEKTFTGGSPPFCEFQVFGFYDKVLEGNPVNFVTIERWLRPKVR